MEFLHFIYASSISSSDGFLRVALDLQQLQAQHLKGNTHRGFNRGFNKHMIPIQHYGPWSEARSVL